MAALTIALDDTYTSAKYASMCMKDFVNALLIAARLTSDPNEVAAIINMAGTFVEMECVLDQWLEEQYHWEDKT